MFRLRPKFTCLCFHSFLFGTYAYRTVLKLKEHSGLVRALSLRFSSFRSSSMLNYQQSPVSPRNNSRSARQLLRDVLIRLDPFGVLTVPVLIRKHRFGSVLWVAILAVFAAHIGLSVSKYDANRTLEFTSVSAEDVFVCCSCVNVIL